MILKRGEVWAVRHGESDLEVRVIGAGAAVNEAAGRRHQITPGDVDTTAGELVALRVVSTPFSRKKPGRPVVVALAAVTFVRKL